MKNLILLAAAAATIFTSCRKEVPPTIETPNEVTISLVDNKSTKTFFDGATATEAWESSLSSLTVLIFDNGGNLIVQRIFNPTEVSVKSANFAIPNAAAGVTCEFYAVANVVVPASVTNKAKLLSMLENDPNIYNSTFGQASSMAVRSGGFVMSGSTSKAIATAGSKTNVGITLYRTVSKIAIQTATTPEFAARYYGRVRVNSATISKAANQTNIIAPSTINSGAKNYSYTQTPNDASGTFQNLFYLFENAAMDAGNRLLLILEATYDRDGNFTTTSDQALVSYHIELSGAGDGEFIRNGYYRIVVNIDGLTGSDATATIAVAPWASPVTQNVNIGQ